MAPKGKGFRCLTGRNFLLKKWFRIPRAAKDQFRNAASWYYLLLKQQHGRAKQGAFAMNE